MSLLDQNTELRPSASASLENRHLSVAYTPDSDDILNFHAWEHGDISLPGTDTTFSRDNIIALNRSCLRGEFDVAAVSGAFYPQIANDYWILSCGTSTGRGYGPVLVAREPVVPGALAGKKVAVG